MKRIISCLLSLAITLSFTFVLCISSGAYDYLDDFDDSNAFLVDFDLTNEEVAYMVEFFKIDPKEHTTESNVYIGVPKEELDNYFNVYTDDDTYLNRRNELAARFGLASNEYLMKYVQESPIVEEKDGVKYVLYELIPDRTKLKGSDFVYFASKLFWAYTVSSYDNKLVCIMSDPLYVGTYTDETYPCDINYDGKINIKDLVLLKSYISGRIDIEDEIMNIKAMDQNGDGKINMRDVTILKQKIAGVYIDD